ncbi:MAG: DUF177 domain-containing protein [Actinobacteria bacterium]|nr:DUF177 domain-containing protein [Actinomycetota bacterium]
MAKPPLVNAAELLRRPGTEKDLDVEVTIADLDLHDERLHDDDPVTARLHLESLTDGIVVRGLVTAPWHGICRRCASPATGEVRADGHELYQQVVTDPDAFELTGDQLDLAPMVREVIVLDAPMSPLCRDDCRGLCPHCGVDLNVESCDCVDAPADPRWGALDQLKGLLDD